MLHTTTFRAMGTDVSIELECDDDAAEAFALARELFELQESRFSRFRRESLLSRLNRGETIHDAALADVVRLAIEANVATGGLFNPMVLPALAEAGYSGSLERIHGGSPRTQQVPPPGDSIEISGQSVRLLGGQVDLGGIAKGWTVDLCARVLTVFASHVVVNAGGDLRTAGEPSDRPFGIACPACNEPVWTGQVQSALATSTSWLRRWVTDNGETAHHLIDPRDGLPARSELVQVSVFAETATEAEVWAKAALIGGERAVASTAERGLGVFVIADEQTTSTQTGGTSNFSRWMGRQDVRGNLPVTGMSSRLANSRNACCSGPTWCK